MTSPSKGDSNVRQRKKGGTGGAEASATPSKAKTSGRAGPPAAAPDGHAAGPSHSHSRSHSQLQQQHWQWSHGTHPMSERRLVLWLAAAGVVLLPLVLLPPALMVEEGPVAELLHDSLRLPRLNVSLPPLPSIVALDSLLASAGFAVPASALNGTTPVNGSAINGLLTLFGVTGDMASAGMDGLTNRTVTAAQQLRAFLAQLPALSIPAGQAPAGTVAGAGAGAEANATAAADETAGLRPGQVMARRGYRAKHPVVIVPGFVTSGLELWRGLPCGQRYFRQRMWGTLAMVQAFLTDAACWFRHMELDTVSGLDPEGIKLRAALGLEAVDYFIQGYWVWGKLVEALADVGYDSNTLVSMPYDWRLAVPMLEERDGYYTRLRRTIEQLVELTGERVVVTSHSYGENVFRAFMHWVEAAAAEEEEEEEEEEDAAAGKGDRKARKGGSGGGGGGGWVDRHIASYINIAGTSLGVPKSVSALLSGETRDTAQLGALAGFLTSNMVPRATRTRVWRSWGASYAMLPVGGPGVWGNVTWAPDDTPDMRAARRTFGSMVSLWPHNWQALMAAAPQQQREQLSQLVANVSQDVGDDADGAASSSSGSSSGSSNGGGSATADAEGAAAASAAGGASGAAAAAMGAAAPPATGAAAAVDNTTAGNGTEATGTATSNSTGSVNSTSSSSSSGGGGGSSSRTSSKAITAIADTLKKLVGGGVDAAEFLNSGQVTRLDVAGFIALLREVGGPLVAANVGQWGAVQLPAREAAEAVRKRAAAASERAFAAASPAAQAVGGADRVKDSTAGGAGAAGIGRGASSAGSGRVALFPDATRTPLPSAPNTNMVCLYGIGLPTERGYHYLRPPPPTGAAAAAAAAATNAPAANATAAPAVDAQQQEQQELQATAGAASGDGMADGTGAADAERGVPPRGAGAAGEEANPDAGGDASAGWMIMKDVTQAQSALDVGVHLSDGDGTVPLLSLGLMCRGGWREKGRLNPGGMRVVTREYKHKAVSMLQDARGGPAAAAHIDILGNDAVLRDVIAVAAGRTDELTDVVVSDIDRIAEAVDWAALAA
ncbi:hypothetical protein HYH02_000382 [Chlamydomonas schloesseri]|uniref:Phospholipid:diacylglycerol acyltransferase n=1 Tax=Chlamydomonas schloesseri TaxID=2026947 RepID=A0A836BCJ3_9CHLO|nr:hypothetical protein HYH02_000382 [Chlamydomonas schloesseri]|eukprot:KAG2454537.1 hypothetical protein HYH02_000382 [Chlamydomonas schloesseri]